MKTVRKNVLVGLVAVLLVSGCAKPPVAEKTAAENAMNAAISLGADSYSSNELDAAKKAFSDADQLMASKKYKQAAEGFIAAQTAFAKAGEMVAETKKTMSAEMINVITITETKWMALAEKIKKLNKKQLKDLAVAWQEDNTIATASLTAAKEANTAMNPLAAKNEIETVNNLINKWDGQLNK